MRLVAPELERKVEGETGAQRNQRYWRNHLAQREFERLAAAICAVCGFANINFRHNVDPEDQIEGPDYYADVTDLHEFVPKP